VFQVPAGLSYATIIRVGQSAGRNSLPQVRRAANASLWICVSFILIAGTVFAAFANFWAGLYTNSPAVVAAAAPIFLFCAFLLLGDTVSVVLSGAMTGLGDTRTPLLVSLACNWGVGMSLAHFLAFHLGYGLHGLWMGRAVGSVSSGLSMMYLWRRRMRREGTVPRRLSLSVLGGLPAADGAA
jgi:MATE family multidrug resistance protein